MNNREDKGEAGRYNWFHSSLGVNMAAERVVLVHRHSGHLLGPNYFPIDVAISDFSLVDIPSMCTATVEDARRRFTFCLHPLTTNDPLLERVEGREEDGCGGDTVLKSPCEEVASALHQHSEHTTRVPRGTGYFYLQHESSGCFVVCDGPVKEAVLYFAEKPRSGGVMPLPAAFRWRSYGESVLELGESVQRTMWERWQMRWPKRNIAGVKEETVDDDGTCSPPRVDEVNGNAGKIGERSVATRESCAKHTARSTAYASLLNPDYVVISTQFVVATHITVEATKAGSASMVPGFGAHTTPLVAADVKTLIRSNYVLASTVEACATQPPAGQSRKRERQGVNTQQKAFRCSSSDAVLGGRTHVELLPSVQYFFQLAQHAYGLPANSDVQQSLLQTTLPRGSGAVTRSCVQQLRVPQNSKPKTLLARIVELAAEEVTAQIQRASELGYPAPPGSVVLRHQTRSARDLVDEVSRQPFVGYLIRRYCTTFLRTMFNELLSELEKPGFIDGIGDLVHGHSCQFGPCSSLLVCARQSPSGAVSHDLEWEDVAVQELAALQEAHKQKKKAHKQKNKDRRQGGTRGRNGGYSRVIGGGTAVNCEIEIDDEDSSAAATPTTYRGAKDLQPIEQYFGGQRNMLGRFYQHKCIVLCRKGISIRLGWWREQPNGCDRAAGETMGDNNNLRASSDLDSTKQLGTHCAEDSGDDDAFVCKELRWINASASFRRSSQVSVAPGDVLAVEGDAVYKSLLTSGFNIVISDTRANDAPTCAAVLRTDETSNTDDASTSSTVDVEFPIRPPDANCTVVSIRLGTPENNFWLRCIVATRAIRKTAVVDWSSNGAKRGCPRKSTIDSTTPNRSLTAYSDVDFFVDGASVQRAGYVVRSKAVMLKLGSEGSTARSVSWFGVVDTLTPQLTEEDWYASHVDSSLPAGTIVPIESWPDKDSTYYYGITQRYRVHNFTPRHTPMLNYPMNLLQSRDCAALPGEREVIAVRKIPAGTAFPYVGPLCDDESNSTLMQVTDTLHIRGGNVVRYVNHHYGFAEEGNVRFNGVQYVYGDNNVTRSMQVIFFMATKDIAAGEQLLATSYSPLYDLYMERVALTKYFMSHNDAVRVQQFVSHGISDSDASMAASERCKQGCSLHDTSKAASGYRSALRGVVHDWYRGQQRRRVVSLIDIVAVVNWSSGCVSRQRQRRASKTNRRRTREATSTPPPVVAPSDDLGSIVADTTSSSLNQVLTNDLHAAETTEACLMEPPLRLFAVIGVCAPPSQESNASLVLEVVPFVPMPGSPIDDQTGQPLHHELLPELLSGPQSTDPAVFTSSLNNHRWSIAADDAIPLVVQWDYHEFATADAKIGNQLDKMRQARRQWLNDYLTRSPPTGSSNATDTTCASTSNNGRGRGRPLKATKASPKAAAGANLIADRELLRLLGGVEVRLNVESVRRHLPPLDVAYALEAVLADSTCLPMWGTTEVRAGV